MMRFVSFAVVAAASATLFGAGAGHAQQRGYYVATAAAAPAKASFVTRSTAWSCDGAVCTAARAPERDAFVCQRVAGNVGSLAAFTAGGEAFDAEALAKCNVKAK
ncbi:MAG TPA: hypothetical protein VM657_14725 [Sphingomonas sp.]|nr:hypothetical protein [Sphingomonas sp.]